jgi:hypothetical protein
VTPVVQAVYSELLERACRPPHARRARGLREAFAERCGSFDVNDAIADAREGAAWESALVESGLASELALGLTDAAEREIALLLERAQRGVFVFARHGTALLAKDLWSNAEFIVAEQDLVGRELAQSDLERDSPICQARVMPTNEGCVLLPGVIFHPQDARPQIAMTLRVARERRLASDDVMDALLRMEHAFRTLSRVKVSFAYRPEALPK